VPEDFEVSDDLRFRVVTRLAASLVDDHHRQIVHVDDCADSWHIDEKRFDRRICDCC